MYESGRYLVNYVYKSKRTVKNELRILPTDVKGHKWERIGPLYFRCKCGMSAITTEADLGENDFIYRTEYSNAKHGNRKPKREDAICPLTEDEHLIIDVIE